MPIHAHGTAASLRERLLGPSMAGDRLGDGGYERGTSGRLAGHGVALRQLVLLVLVELVDVGAGELARGNLLGEEDVEFVEGAVLGGLLVF